MYAGSDGDVRGIGLTVAVVEVVVVVAGTSILAPQDPQNFTVAAAGWRHLGQSLAPAVKAAGRVPEILLVAEGLIGSCTSISFAGSRTKVT